MDSHTPGWLAESANEIVPRTVKAILPIAGKILFWLALKSGSL